MFSSGIRVVCDPSHRIFDQRNQNHCRKSRRQDYCFDDYYFPVHFLFLLYFALTFYLQFRPGLKHYRYDDECDAQDKREVQLLVFVENNHGDNDAVNRFQIVCEVDREGVNLL